VKIRECEFTIFDVETTGLSPYSGDKICEIAALRVDSSRGNARKFSSLVDPGRPISYGAFRVNGITGEMVADKPRIGEILPGFLKFAEGSVLVAYNAGFDIGFLESALGDEKGALKDYFVIDALALARRFFPDAGRYSLGVLARHLGIASPVEHRALADVRMTWKVFEKELDIIASEGVEDIEEIAYRRVEDYKPRLVEEAIREQRAFHHAKGGMARAV